jgi:hypothetical protein
VSTPSGRIWEQHSDTLCRTTASGIRHVAEKRARAVRLLNIPADAQEGLLQQALEKIVPVRRVELFAHNGTAVVELEKEAVSLSNLHMDYIRV